MHFRGSDEGLQAGLKSGCAEHEGCVFLLRL